MKKIKIDKPKPIKHMNRKELMEKIKQMEQSKVEAVVESRAPEANPAVQLQTVANDDFIEMPAGMKIHHEAEQGLKNPEIFNELPPDVKPLTGSAKARQLMSLPEIPSMNLPDPKLIKKLPASSVPTEYSVTPKLGSAVLPQFSIAQNMPEPKQQQQASSEFPWRGKGVFIAIPCYKFTNPATMWVAVQLALDLGRDNAQYDMEMGDAMIYHARNKLAKRFLASSCEWMFFLDDDVVPPTGRATWTRWVGNLPHQPWSDEILSRHVLKRLIGHGKSLVGGTYFGRQITGVPVSSAAWNPQEETMARSMMNMVRPVDWVGTGCMVIHRSVFEAIQSKFPHLAPAGQRKWWDFFLPTEHGGEDVSFCARAKAAGHQPWLDTGLQCLHIGWGAYGAHNTGQKAQVVVE